MKYNIIYLFFTLTSPLVYGQTTDTLSADSISHSSVNDFIGEKDTLSARVDSLLLTRPLTVPDTNRLSLVFAGDIMGHDTQIEGAFNAETNSYDYEPTFRYIKDYVSQADIAVGNLEVTLAGPPYKGYPEFSSPDALAEEAWKAGFDVLVNANNHALDRGTKGFVRTLEMLDSLSFLRAGTYYDSLDRDTLYPLIVEKNNIRIAFLNYTYGTNGLKIPPPYIVNRIDTAQITADLSKAKLADPDYIIVLMHWGKEYERTENSLQVRLARHIFRKGGDAIIGSHPHVVQPVKYLVLENDTSVKYPVFYSMGNFVSNQRAQYKDGGVMAELHLQKVNGKVTLSDLRYLPYWVWRQDDAAGKSTFYVVPLARYEANTDEFPFTPSDEYKFRRFSTDTRTHLSDILESEFYSTFQPDTPVVKETAK